MTLNSAGRAACRMATILFVCFFVASKDGAAAAEVVNVYSSRGENFVGPLLQLFEDLTGVKTNVVYYKKGLIDKIAAEAENSPVDVILANVFNQLIAAKERGLTQSAQRPELVERVPIEYRDLKGHWFGLSKRARIVLASKARVGQDTFTYEELADPKWKGRICIRSAKHPYNTVLISSFIAHKGEAWTEKWLRGLKSNLAIKPAGGDRTQAANIYLNKCDIAVVNSYYMGAMLTNKKQPEQKLWAESVKLIFPNAEGQGSHVSISGMALARHAPNPKNGALLMDFLTSKPAQFFYALVNHEYPIRKDIRPSALVASWGNYKFDDIPLMQLARSVKKAEMLVRKTDFDHGPAE